MEQKEFDFSRKYIDTNNEVEWGNAGYLGHLGKLDGNKKNGMLPSPPKPGEVMICQMCGKPMLPEHFAKDKKTAMREFKWHIHHTCFNQASAVCDSKTHGLMEDRKQTPVARKQGPQLKKR